MCACVCAVVQQRTAPRTSLPLSSPRLLRACSAHALCTLRACPMHAAPCMLTGHSTGLAARAQGLDSHPSSPQTSIAAGAAAHMAASSLLGWLHRRLAPIAASLHTGDAPHAAVPRGATPPGMQAPQVGAAGAPQVGAAGAQQVGAAGVQQVSAARAQQVGAARAQQVGAARAQQVGAARAPQVGAAGAQHAPGAVRHQGSQHTCWAESRVARRNDDMPGPVQLHAEACMHQQPARPCWGGAALLGPGEELGPKPSWTSLQGSRDGTAAAAAASSAAATATAAAAALPGMHISLQSRQDSVGRSSGGGSGGSDGSSSAFAQEVAQTFVRQRLLGRAAGQPAAQPAAGHGNVKRGL